MTTVKKLLLWTLLCSVWVFTSTAHAASIWVSFECGSKTIWGSLQTSDVAGTSVDLTIENEEWVVDTQAYTFTEDGDQTILIDPASYDDGLYAITMTATLGEQTSTWTHKTFLWDDCDSLKDVKARMVVYANEAKEYFDNVQDIQHVPDVMLKTGLGDWIDNKISSSSKSFVVAASTTYHDIPEWTGEPNGPSMSFEEQYALVPDEYRDAYSYLQFKWMLVPIQLPGTDHSEEALLDVLNSGMMMAPETADINTIGNVKMVYSHSLSFVESPFSWVGSYLSLFSELGDTVTVYAKKWYVSYEKRTYTIKNRLQIKPEQASLLKNFKKPGVDSLALITCKSGDTLWSTQGREVLLLERIEAEMWDFQKEIVKVSRIPSLADQKRQFDAFLATKEFDGDDAAILVKKLEEAQLDGANPLQQIALYGKYMASYEAIYN